MIKAIAKLILALNGNVKKTQLAAGFAWGVLLGLIPAGNPFWIAIFFISFFLRHNHAAKLLAMILCMLLVPALATLIDQIGWAVLHIGALHETFTKLYNMPFVPFTKFYNTMVMGGLVSGIVLWIPVFVIFMILIPLYREKLNPKIANSKFVQKLLKFPLFAAIDKAMGVEG